jgi:hypothetical protein
MTFSAEGPINDMKTTQQLFHWLALRESRRAFSSQLFRKEEGHRWDIDMIAAQNAH